MQHQAQTHSADFSWKDFVAAIYKQEPQPAHSFSIQALDEIPSDALKKYLAHFLVYGAKTLYNKQLADLSESETAKLRQYLLSIGWKVEYKVETRQQQLKPESDVTTPVNYFLIDFIPAKRDELNDTNKPDRFA